MQFSSFVLILFSLLVGPAVSVSCPTLIAKLPAPSTAPGVVSRLVANNLTTPRGLVFDRAGHLLVLDRGIGIRALTFSDTGSGCVTVSQNKTILANRYLNHAVELADNDTILLTSTSDAVYAYKYNPNTATIISGPVTLVTGMDNPDHFTRTILHSKKSPSTIVINRGTSSNIDAAASNKSTGHGQVKSFRFTNFTSNNLATIQARDFTKNGTILGWGVRNDVGIAEHPSSGGIWTVENSVDDVTRYGQKFNNENPGEKLNYMGTIVGNTSPNQGSNFGYPECFAAWNASQVPNAGTLQTGQQFSISPDVISDSQCRTNRTAPRLVFDAHMAPLDIKFSKFGNAAYVTFHGSYDRAVPQGYKVSAIAFRNGQPVAPSNSTTAVIDLASPSVSQRAKCPSGCARPVGIAIDKNGRLFYSADSTGEIYMLTGIPT